MKKFLISLMIANFLCAQVSPVFAVGFDASIDDDIRKNYNPSKLEQDMALPVLPTNLNTNSSYQEPIPVKQYNPEPPKKNLFKAKTQKNVKPSVPNVETGKYAVLKRGTKFQTQLLTSLSGGNMKGTNVYFVTKYPVTTTYLTVPSGTKIIGEIQNAHTPQFAGNGGLIVVKINSMVLGNSTHEIEGVITQTNKKSVFFNNIKGKRKFGQTFIGTLKPGVGFFKDMTSRSLRLLNDGWAAVWSPFPLAAGVVGLGANVVAAPVVAFFTKGGPVMVRAGSIVEVKLTKDVIIYN